MAPTRKSSTNANAKSKAKPKKTAPKAKRNSSTASTTRKSSTSTASQAKRNSATSVASSKKKRNSAASNGNNSATNRNSSKKNLNNSSRSNHATAAAASSSTPALTPEERRIQKLVAQGAYHLPGNGWCQDWIQYVCNNHPLLAPCCQHKLHPISKWMRAVGLLGSLMMGLVITNVVYLLLIRSDDDNDPLGAAGDATPVFQLSAGGFAVKNGTQWVYLEEDSAIAEYTSLEVSSGMVVLWTVGGVIHALWDNAVWYLTSCSCCGKDDDGSRRNSGSRRNNSLSDDGCFAKCIAKSKGLVNVLVVTGVLLITAAATVAVVVRAHVEGGGDVDSALQNLQSTAGFGNRVEDAEVVSNKDNYEYLLSYSVELALAWFFWFPVLTTITFSGVFSRCLPCLGSRPQEVKKEEARGRLPR